MIQSKLSALAASTLAVLALALATAPEADAGWPSCHRARRRCVPRAYRAARPAAPAAYPPPHPVAAPRAVTASPGPLAWLNAVRQTRGLRPLAHDPALDADATRNSAIGYNHNTHGWRRGQVVGWGALAAVEVMWLQSPAHYAILMDPHATSAGFGMVGSVSTIDVN